MMCHNVREATFNIVSNANRRSFWIVATEILAEQSKSIHLNIKQMQRPKSWTVCDEDNGQLAKLMSFRLLLPYFALLAISNFCACFENYAVVYNKSSGTFRPTRSHSFVQHLGCGHSC